MEEMKIEDNKIIIPEGYIKCSGCKKYMNNSEFGKNKARKNGLNSSCKECGKEASKRSYSKQLNSRAKNILRVLNKWIKFKKDTKKIQIMIDNLEDGIENFTITSVMLSGIDKIMDRMEKTYE